MALGKRLKQLLDERGMTVKEFATLINVPATTLYSFIKRDSQNAKMELIAKICKGLNIDIDELLTITEDVDGNEASILDLTCLNTPEQITLTLKSLLENGNIKIQNAETGEIKEYHLNSNSTVAYFTNEEFTEEELEEIRDYAEFVKSKRSFKKKKQNIAELFAGVNAAHDINVETTEELNLSLDDSDQEDEQ